MKQENIFTWRNIVTFLLIVLFTCVSLQTYTSRMQSKRISTLETVVESQQTAIINQQQYIATLQKEALKNKGIDPDLLFRDEEPDFLVPEKEEPNLFVDPIIPKGKPEPFDPYKFPPIPPEPKLENEFPPLPEIPALPERSDFKIEVKQI